jgi:hypothetical protein
MASLCAGAGKAAANLAIQDKILLFEINSLTALAGESTIRLFPQIGGLHFG